MITKRQSCKSLRVVGVLENVLQVHLTDGGSWKFRRYILSEHIESLVVDWTQLTKRNRHRSKHTGLYRVGFVGGGALTNVNNGWNGSEHRGDESVLYILKESSRSINTSRINNANGLDDLKWLDVVRIELRHVASLDAVFPNSPLLLFLRQSVSRNAVNGIGNVRGTGWELAIAVGIYAKCSYGYLGKSNENRIISDPPVGF
jgi:hypothetical protein